MKMAVLLQVLLVVAGTFLSSSEAQDDSTKVTEAFRKGVDLAVQQVNSHIGVQNHFLFFKSLEKSSMEGGFDVIFFNHHFTLKATRCRRGTENPNSKKCPFRNDRPLIDCFICYKTYGGDIEKEPKPYVHCIHKPALTEDMKQFRVEHCKSLAYSSGASTLLASTGTH